jgi:NAD(P)H-nitrite reductase large subunit
MNNIHTDNPNRKKDVICHCSGTTQQQIMRLIDNEAGNLESISRITGACSGCGACETAILELLAEYNTLAFKAKSNALALSEMPLS